MVPLVSLHLPLHLNCIRVHNVSLRSLSIYAVPGIVEGLICKPCGASPHHVCFSKAQHLELEQPI